MSSNAMSLAPTRGSKAGKVIFWLGCAALAVLGVRFLSQVLLRYIHFDAEHYRIFWAAKWWLVAHLGGGSLALLLGPFQFSGWLRRRYVKAHRWMGLLYLLGVLLGSIAALYMGLYVARKAFGHALLYLDLAWVVTTGMAYLAVLRRQFAAHREWMIRSYVVTFGFVLFRWMGRDLKMYASLNPDAQSVMLSWLCWAVPLLFVEMALQWRRTVGPGR
jgi:hypothetical protein